MPLKDKAARTLYNREYRERPGSKEKAKETRRRFDERNPCYMIGYYREYKESNPMYYKKRHLKKYNLTLEEYNSIFWLQHGKCAICKSTVHNGKGWHIDHDHTTNKVRGILCNNCNVALGHLKEDIELFKEAINYLITRRGK